MKNILVIDSPFMATHIGGTSFGGIEVYVDTFVRCAVSNGYKVTVVTTSDSTLSVEYVGKVTMLHTDSKSKQEINKINPGKKIRFPYNEMTSIINTLNFNDFDLVLNNCDKPVINRYLSNKVIKDNYPRKVVSYLHNPPIYRGSYESAQKFNKFCTNIQFVLNSVFNFNSWKKITDNDELKELNMRLNFNPLKVNNRNLLATNGFNNRNLLAVGRIVKHKGLINLKNLANKYPDINCHIIGSIGDDTYNDLNDNKPNNLHFHLNLNNEEKIKLIYELKGWICSFSCDETYGISAAEGFEMGLPLLVIDINNTNIPYFIKFHENVTELKDSYVCPLGICMKKGYFKPEDIYKKLDMCFDQSVIKNNFDSNFCMNLDHITKFIEISNN